ncbi:protein CYR61, partial [Biomphalaria pfeifferi]
ELGFCQYPCQCPNEEFMCENGVQLVKDGCSCCMMCPRQLGDLCSKKDKCDVTKGLYCDNKNENTTGICRGKANKPCNVDGVLFQDGEKFQPHCSQLCTCQNGFYGCVNQCPQELQKPSELTCHEPKLIKANNKCCKEWTCQKMEARGNWSRGRLESGNLVNKYYITPAATKAPAPLANHRRQCQGEATDWSQCSVTCGVGVSMRIVVDSISCLQHKETRVCFVRPCHVNVSTLVVNGPPKCTPTTKGQGPEHIHFQGCESVKGYRLKFCTNCQVNKCCYPAKTKVKEIVFQCRGTREKMAFLWIKKCRCDDVCYVKDRPRDSISSRRSRNFRSHRIKKVIV